MRMWTTQKHSAAFALDGLLRAGGRDKRTQFRLHLECDAVGARTAISNGMVSETRLQVRDSNKIAIDGDNLTRQK